eukprot:TRINITY_DN112785_c0_g1_i1.p1 TRINITY_DN112785_c0_g1~~TRINITY_DN112785_c0_g1_i1.p1  ORF type:complete len:315 (+),score=49.51 TRINITY_DN112785_c0_g1_i1:65-946(+)
MVARPLATSLVWETSRSCPSYTLTEDCCAPWLEDQGGTKRFRLDEEGTPIRRCPGSASRSRRLHHAVGEQDCPVPLKRQRLCCEDLLPNIQELYHREENASLEHQSSTFSWGDLSNLSSTGPSVPTLLIEDLRPGHRGENIEILQDGACEELEIEYLNDSVDLQSASSCKALVPYRTREEASHAACLTWKLKGLEPAPMKLPRPKIKVAEVTVRGDHIFVLPELALPYKSNPNAEEVTIPWDKNLSIVLYRGEGCNLPLELARIQKEADRRVDVNVDSLNWSSEPDCEMTVTE